MKPTETVRILNRGKSFEYSRWEPLIQYTNDCFKQDFVSYKNCILACVKSHLSDPNNEPSLQYGDLENRYLVTGVDSEYWELVIPYTPGVIYIPNYNEETGELTWRISNEPEDVQSTLIDNFVWRKPEGLTSASLGKDNVIEGNYSMVAGQGLETKNDGEVAFGKYNKSVSNTKFTIGIGDSNIRKNAVEVTDEGEVYIKGIGNYDGTNVDSSKDLSFVFNELPFEKGSADNSAVLKGGDNQAKGLLSTAFGRKNKSTGVYGHSEGEFNESIGARAHSEGCYTKAEGADSHAENEGSIARGINSHAEGYYTLASGITSHAEGASRANDPEYNPDEPAFAVVEKYLEARGQRSHAEGYATQAFGNQSHAEGIDTLAEGTNSHAEGQETQALSNNSHSEGNKTVAKGADTHAEGYNTTTNGWASHAEGIETYTTNQGEHAQGKYNVSTKSSVASEATIHSVGIGSSGKRRNAQEVKADGKHYILGIGGYDGTNPTDSEDLATVVNNKAEKTDIVQADWNQNNRNAKDYINNRPFYSFINTPFTEVYPEESDPARIELSIGVEDNFCIRTPYWVIGPFNDMDDESYEGLYTPYGNIINVFRDDTLFYLNTDVNDTIPIIEWLNENAYVGFNENNEDLVKYIPDIYISSNIARKSEITRLENRIVELEDIIKQITIKVEE